MKRSEVVKKSVCEEKGGGRSAALVLFLRISGVCIPLSIALALWIGRVGELSERSGSVVLLLFFRWLLAPGSSEGVKGKEKRRNRVWSVILRSIFPFGRIFENQTVELRLPTE